ncbi:uncharacterized protein LOC141915267 [Tubulanus polymorphus]|uniref:uncharacterized protein LOC141915267 n=1 Tax=Tubulanus polymorphus TaxID=672921 RepID=UPI003DA5361C
MPWYIGEEPPRALRPDQALVERRPRHHSDDFDMERVAPLPDLIQFRRDRSRSEPSVTPIFSPEEAGEWGRQLRRISDEFHFSYSFEGRLGSIAENTPPDDNQSSSYPGARRNWIQTLYQRIVRPTRRHSQSDLEPGPVLRKNHFWREQ